MSDKTRDAIQAREEAKAASFPVPKRRKPKAK